MPNHNDGTGAGLIAFIDRAAKRGEIPRGTATALRISVTHILGTEEVEFDAIDIRSLDVEDLIQRFENLKSAELSPASISTYRSRFRQAVSMYKKYLDGGSWKPVIKIRRPKNGTNGRSTEEKSPTASDDIEAGTEIAVDQVPTQSAPLTHRSDAVAQPALVSYSLPLRPDLIVRIELPIDLTGADAARISAFVKSLAFDERLQLPPGRSDAGGPPDQERRDAG
ncbi:hypothetical protein [Streptomyces sp. NPDC057253]|uniref:hypothetical protein n=1 Tax=Streptomyces sp. NPDC057253 TaxID=3346069 RepID=UPI003642911F